MLTFLVIGAQKSGTTWLYHMMKQHPGVAVSHPKEVDFFNRRENYERGIDWYRAHFPGAAEGKAVGEFAPNYWWTEADASEVPEVPLMPNVPELVHRHFSKLKLIVSLRDPVRRAISAYLHHIRAGRISPRQRISECLDRYGIVTMGHYDVHLSNWTRWFPLDDLLVLIYEEDLTEARKGQTLKRVFSHVGVDSSFRPSGVESRFNARARDFDLRISGLPSVPRRLLSKITPDWIKDAAAWDIEVDEREIQALRRHFDEHNRALAQLLGRELPW